MDIGKLYKIPDETLRHLDCPICKERLKYPKIINCSHVFCQLCLENHVQMARGNFPPCPVCRIPMTIPRGGVCAYPTHRFSAEFIQSLENQPKCRVCGVPDNGLILCQKCKELVCHACIETKHCSRSRLIQVLNTDLTTRQSFCEKHHDQKNEFYCVNCKSPCCKICSNSYHLSHKKRLLSEKVTECTERISNMLTEVQRFSAEIQGVIHDVETINAKFQRDTETTRQKTEAEFNKIIQRINEQKEKVQDELRHLKEKTEKRFQNEIKDLETKKAIARDIEQCSFNVLNDGYDYEILETEKTIAQGWKTLKDEPLRRYGKSFQLTLQVSLNERFLELLECDIGVLKFCQHLDPWPRRRIFEENEVVQNFLDSNPPGTPEEVIDALRQSYPIKHSEVFSKLCDSRYRFRATKICSITGYTATAWINVNLREWSSEFSETMSAKLGCIPNVAKTFFNAILEVDVYKESGVLSRKITKEHIINTATVRLALNENGCVQIAVYPGSSVWSEENKNWSKKKQNGKDKSIYVAFVQETGTTADKGTFRRIDILETVQDPAKLAFDITKCGYLAVHHPSISSVSVYSPAGDRRDIDYPDRRVNILGVFEARGGEILVLTTIKRLIIGDEYTVEGEQKPLSFRVRYNGDTGTLFPELQIKNACIDMKGNILLLYREAKIDHLVIIRAGASTEEILCKPEMLHEVDQMSILSNGRVCLFDKTEVRLMIFQYLQ